MNKHFYEDYYRMTGRKFKLLGRGIIDLFLRYDLRYMLCLRTKRHSFLRKLCFRHYASKYGLEILCKQIGGGVYLGHAHNINVNPDAIIDRNCNINKGATIGKENRGKRKGAPILGDCVWIGVNATVVGKVTIGNDVLIAPNSYVNFDVPDHSIVIGNPGRIIHKEDATLGYINNCINGDK